MFQSQLTGYGTGLYYNYQLFHWKAAQLTFMLSEEALIIYTEGKVDIHAIVNVVVKDLDQDGQNRRCG